MNVNNVVDAVEHLTGFVIVLLALVVLWGVTALVGRIFASAAKSPVAPAPAEAVTPAPAAAPSEELDDEVIVVAAAAAALLGARHRIVAVRPLTSFWGMQGRRDIHASHRFR